MAFLSWVLLLLHLSVHATSTVALTDVLETIPKKTILTASPAAVDRRCLQPTLCVLDGDLENVYLCRADHTGWTRYPSCYDQCDVKDSKRTVCSHRSDNLHGCWLSPDHVGEGTGVNDEIFKHENAAVFVPGGCGGVLDGLYVQGEGHTVCRDGRKVNATHACLQSLCEVRPSDRTLVCRTKVNPVWGLFCAVLGLNKTASGDNQTSAHGVLMGSTLKTSNLSPKQPPALHSMKGQYLIETRTLIQVQMDGVPQPPTRDDALPSYEMVSGDNQPLRYDYFRWEKQPQPLTFPRNDGVVGGPFQQPYAPQNDLKKPEKGPVNNQNHDPEKLTPVQDPIAFEGERFDLRDFLGEDAERILMRKRRSSEPMRNQSNVTTEGQKKNSAGSGQTQPYAEVVDHTAGQELEREPSSPNQHVVASNAVPVHTMKKMLDNTLADKKENKGNSFDGSSDRLQKASASIDSMIIPHKLPTGGNAGITDTDYTLSDQQSKLAKVSVDKVSPQESLKKGNDQNVADTPTKSKSTRPKESSQFSKIPLSKSHSTMDSSKDRQKSENNNSTTSRLQYSLDKTPSNKSAVPPKLEQSNMTTLKPRNHSLSDPERHRPKTEPKRKDGVSTTTVKSVSPKKENNLNGARFLKNFISFLNRLSDIRRADMPETPTRQPVGQGTNRERAGIKQKDKSVDTFHTKPGSSGKTDQGINMHFHMIVEKKLPADHHAEEEAGIAVVSVQAGGAPAQRKLNVLQRVKETEDDLTGEKLAKPWKEPGHGVLADALRRIVQTQVSDHHRLQAAGPGLKPAGLPMSQSGAQENLRTPDRANVHLSQNKATKSSSSSNTVKVPQALHKITLSFPDLIVVHLNRSNPVTRIRPGGKWPVVPSVTKDALAGNAESGTPKHPLKQTATGADLTRSRNTGLAHAQSSHEPVTLNVGRKPLLPEKALQVEQNEKAKPSKEDGGVPLMSSVHLGHNPTARVITLPRSHDLEQGPTQTTKRVIPRKDEVANNVHQSIRKRPGIPQHFASYARDKPVNKSVIPSTDRKEGWRKTIDSSIHGLQQLKENPNRNVKIVASKIQSATERKLEKPFRENAVIPTDNQGGRSQTDKTTRPFGHLQSARSGVAIPLQPKSQVQIHTETIVQRQNQQRPNAPKQKHEDSSVAPKTDSNAQSHGHEKQSAQVSSQQELGTDRHQKQGSNAERYRQLESGAVKHEQQGSNNEKHQQQGSNNEIHQQQQGSNNEIHQQQGSNDEIHHQQQGSNNEIHQQQQESNNEIHQQQQGSNNEIHQQQGSNSEIHQQQQQGSNNEIHQQQQGSNNEIHQQQQGSNNEIHQQQGSNNEKLQQQGSNNEKLQQQGSNNERHQQQGSNNEKHQQQGSNNEIHQQQQGSNNEIHQQQGSNNEKHQQEGPDAVAHEQQVSKDHIQTGLDGNTKSKNVESKDRFIPIRTQQHILVNKKHYLSRSSQDNSQSSGDRKSSQPANSGGDTVAAPGNAKLYHESPSVESPHPAAEENNEGGLHPQVGAQKEGSAPEQLPKLRGTQRKVRSLHPHHHHAIHHGLRQRM